MLAVAAVGQVALRGRHAADTLFSVLVLAGSALGIAAAVSVLRTGVTLSTTIRSALPGGNWVIGVDPLSAVFLVAILGVGALCAVYGIDFLVRSMSVTLAGWLPRGRMTGG